MRFIDMLDVTQQHPEGGLPLVGKEMISTVDLKTGERLRESPNKMHIEGSYSSKLTIRCDGMSVTVTGNPSRWHRADNLFGFTTFDECIQVYNTILREHGLPPFTKCTQIAWVQGEDGKRARRMTDGAVFTRVDWTRNLSVGKGNEVAFLRALAGQSMGRGKRPNLYPNGHTVDWGKGSSYWYQKVYNKAEDLRISLRKRQKGALTADEVKYLKRLITYCDDQGIIRDEREFKRSFLDRKNLRYYGLTQEIAFREHLNDVERMIERLEMSTADIETIADQLIEREIVKSRLSASSTQGHAMAWLHGQDVKASISKSQFHVHRNRLLELGIDIANPFDATRSVVQLRRKREIYVSTALPPDWYQMPKTTSLRLVL